MPQAAVPKRRITDIARAPAPATHEELRATIKANSDKTLIEVCCPAGPLFAHMYLQGRVRSMTDTWIVFEVEEIVLNDETIAGGPRGIVQKFGGDGYKIRVAYFHMTCIDVGLGHMRIDVDHVGELA